MLRVIVECDGARGESMVKDGGDITEACECFGQALYAAGFRFKGYVDILEDGDCDE